ncbi:SDH family Clp fold serine proteinase [Thermovibrio ammonificans]|jgi:ClpP class serine protease|uniref:Periplasmic serine protease n=1 Tax=Thermovibrio ammonificans (strain DSM 15698 / JCM 12110 / HB-1) TaxID=648996 RepID=E8T3N7_THEA1|nr:ATP-dependent Clp protease proteolytic subunit [Thermovibrio ammonificans]ADU97294.1 periplasmic serine protease [Thermovibrio ammonificans HB-1]
MAQQGVSPFDIFWIIIIFFSLWPLFQQKNLEWARLRLIREIEKKRKSRVITMIHRQERLAFMGFPIVRFITIEDSERVLRAIRMTPDDMPIDFIIHTPGGLALAATQIASALVKHKAPVRVIVPHYAMSGGTLIALAADEIVMDPNAVLGPLDPQIGQFPAPSIVKAVREKLQQEKGSVKEESLILADVAEKALFQMKQTIERILASKGHSPEKAREIADLLTSGYWTHDYPLTVEVLKELGLKVSTEVPKEVYDLMELYYQPSGQASVQFIPVPYGEPKKGEVPVRKPH